MKPKLCQRVGNALKKASPTVLTCIGAVGVVATAVLAVKAPPKALELVKADSRKNHDGDPHAATKMEAVKSCWKCYIPATFTGATTIACIFGANILNKRQQASLASAYALVSRSYNDYKRKLKELYGEEAHKKIMESLAVEKAKDIPISSASFVGHSSLDFEDAVEETRLFYDPISERYFESTIGKVLQAEYHLNRNFMFAGYISLNEFYEFLGIEETELGATVGWNSCNGDIFWIDFNHSKAMVDDGLNGEIECYIIDMVFPPDNTYLEDV